ncbi:MAG: hypothetical protein HFF42_00065 [Lawsonibacter sp.]|jgi:hypothetical protein|nr:hypothetical protein [Lawsonibacter sp.]
MEYKQLKELLFQHECKHPNTHLSAYITFASFGPDNKTEYPWKSRTYLVSSDNKAFQPNKGGYSIFGDCLDGTDQGVRLEQYIKEEHGGNDGWVVEDCGIAGYVLIECYDCGISTPKLFYTYSDALECMLSLMAEVGGLDAGQLKKDFAATKDLFEEGRYGAGHDSAWLSDSSLDWHWKIQPVYIYGPLKLVFPNPEDKPYSIQAEQHVTSNIQSSEERTYAAMKLDQFNQMALGDPLTLLAALELLLQNGRSMIQSQQASELVSSCQLSLGAFFTESKLCEIVDVCQRLAGLETRALVDYIHRGSLEIKDPGADEKGICPICGGELEYGDDEPLDDGGVYEWTCPSCGATGKEGYDKVFDKHYSVHDGDGKPYERNQ